MRDRRDDPTGAGLIRTALLIAVVALAALVLTGCERLFPDVEDWITDSETLARRHRYHRMSAVEKAEVLARVASSSAPKRKVLSELGVPRSTYYRWLRGREQEGLEDHQGGGKPPWNRLTSREVDHVLSAAREMPELSPRQLASWVTDNMGFSVSESTVYSILRREGLVKRPEMRLAAGKEYHRKTTGPHQMWTTDASYFRVVGWGYYYLVTVFARMQ